MLDPWINAAARPPEHGWIVMRWWAGPVWAGNYDGCPTLGSCDEWKVFPKPPGHVKDGIVTLGTRPNNDG